MRDIPAGELTAEQVQLLVKQLTAIYQQLSEVVDMMSRYAAAGGRDWETWDRLLDGLGRRGTMLMQYTGDPVHPDWQGRFQAVSASAGIMVGRSLEWRTVGSRYSAVCWRT